VSVTDTGDGVSEEDLDQLFERYFRTDASRRSTAVGSGLGLGISRDIAVRHGGSLTAVSQVGIGSTFSLVLPITPGD
jgi:signal transduction histidine kinase